MFEAWARCPHAQTTQVSACAATDASRRQAPVSRMAGVFTPEDWVREQKEAPLSPKAPKEHWTIQLPSLRPKRRDTDGEGCIEQVSLRKASTQPLQRTERFHIGTMPEHYHISSDPEDQNSRQRERMAALRRVGVRRTRKSHSLRTLSGNELDPWFSHMQGPVDTLKDCRLDTNLSAAEVAVEVVAEAKAAAREWEVAEEAFEIAAERAVEVSVEETELVKRDDAVDANVMRTLEVLGHWYPKVRAEAERATQAAQDAGHITSPTEALDALFSNIAEVNLPFVRQVNSGPSPVNSGVAGESVPTLERCTEAESVHEDNLRLARWALHRVVQVSLLRMEQQQLEAAAAEAAAVEEHLEQQRRASTEAAAEEERLEQQRLVAAAEAAAAEERWVEEQRLAVAAEAAAAAERLEHQRLAAAAEASALEEQTAAELAAQAEAEVAAALAAVAAVAEADAHANVEEAAAQSEIAPEIPDFVQTSIEEGGCDSCEGFQADTNLQVTKSVQIEGAVPLRSLAQGSQRIEDVEALWKVAQDTLSREHVKKVVEREAALQQYTLEQLTNPQVWQKLQINPAERELLLPENTFRQLFSMDKRAFGTLPKWKRHSLKKRHGLF